MDWRRFARQMATMACDLLAQPSVDATLERITGSAMELMEGCDAAGVLILRGEIWIRWSRPWSRATPSERPWASSWVATT